MSSYIPLNSNGKRPIDGNSTSSNKRTAGGTTTPTAAKFWMVQWRNPQYKKHKTWDSDGVLRLQSGRFTLYDMQNSIITTGKALIELEPDQEVTFGGKDILIDRAIPPQEYYSGVCFGKGAPSVQSESLPPANPTPALRKKFVTLTPARNSINAASKAIALESTSLSEHVDDTQPRRSRASSEESDPYLLVKKKSSNPVQVSAVPSPSVSGFYKQVQKPKVIVTGPLHDPNCEGAIVMKEPGKYLQSKFNKENLPIIPVVIDPIVQRHLRPHQIEGVKFLYDCVMGMRKHEGQGGILADEMGLGKSLQTVSLIWTLLKQTPYPGQKPVIGKALIACPVSLINNWKAEFHKWLGRDRLGIFIGDKDKSAIKQFVNSRIHQVLIIGYERLRTVIDELAYCVPPVGLIVCDEGHRLKSANAKINKMFEALRTPRRIILSGTPIQNDLGEFHAMADFCNPGLLDEYSIFRKIYENPILKSRAPDSTPQDRKLGEARAEQLLAISKNFVLRREATILSNYLPPKNEYVLFVKPTSLQMDIFAEVLNPDRLNSVIQGPTARSLALITQLTKISNSPSLLKGVIDPQRQGDPDEDGSDLVKGALEIFCPSERELRDVTTSGKLLFLAALLRKLRKNTEEKCVIVSHYTATLDVIEAFCTSKQYKFQRLDGQTPMQKRQEYVNRFNKTSQDDMFLFLLSAKAGGVGLNLIGASRLVLVDSDWNPSHDLQAMARIHRDGQKRPVYIYRLLSAGTIDEKIYQRQITKMGLSNSFIRDDDSSTTEKNKNKSDSFSTRELRDIFTIRSNVACHTHELLECQCMNEDVVLDGLDSDLPTSNPDVNDSESDSDEDLTSHFSKDAGFMVASQVDPTKLERQEKSRKKAKALQALTEWTHIDCLRSASVEAIKDELLSTLVWRPFDKSKGVADDDGNGARHLELSDLDGGSLTFIFERCSDSKIDKDAEG